MRTIPYSQLERGLLAVAGIDPSNALAHEKILIAEYISDATKIVWDHYPWPETIRVEKRTFREPWTKEGTYEVGDEVFYQGKYYRKYLNDMPDTIQNWEDIEGWQGQERTWFPLFGIPDQSLIWHQIGDGFQADEWEESGLYAIGAVVEYDGNFYICVQNRVPENNLDPSLAYVNYSQNGINITNKAYWQKIDTSFDRYIGYNQENEEPLGTIVSVHMDDPRHSSGTPLKWQLSQVGIYIELPTETNEVWVKFRENPPTYLPEDGDKPVLSHLSLAIKAYAYKSWLVGEGQHEKAALQDQMALDLLVKEIDKLVHHIDMRVAV
jgi:chitodextrinase